MRKSPAVDQVGLGIVAHPRSAIGVRRNAGRVSGRSPDLDRAGSPKPLFDFLLAELRGTRFVFLKPVCNPAYRIAQRIADGGIEIQEDVFIREGGGLQISRRPARGVFPHIGFPAGTPSGGATGADY